MSIYSETLQGRRGIFATALVSGGLLAALSTPSSAQTAVVAGKPTPVGVGTTVGTTVTRMVALSGHVPDLVRQSEALGALPASQSLQFSIVLPLRNQAALADLLKGLNDPNDARYGQYLTPAQIGAQFGPSQAQYNAVIAYLASKGLTITQTFAARTYLSVTGTTTRINNAFGVTLKQFRSPEGRVFHAPDSEVKVPSSIAGYVVGVVGLDDAAPPQPLMHMLRRAAGPPQSVKVIGSSLDGLDDPAPYVGGTGPQGGFAPSDLRTAYGLDATTLKGAGQTIAMVEFGTNFNIKDILKYETVFGLPRVPIASVFVDGGPTVYSGASTETVLDIDMQISMAPQASQILVFLQPNTGSVTDALNAVLADGRAKQLSVSYGFGAESASRTDPSPTQVALNTVYTQLATAGVSVYVSSGDSGSQARSGNNVVGIDISSSTPNVCSVGGTSLSVQSPGVNEAYKAESTWNDGPTSAGGGGVSKQWTIAGNASFPGATYQANAAAFASTTTVTVNGTTLPSNVSPTMRNIPDIACNADPNTGVSIYTSVDPTLTPGWYIFGGTSEAAPLWAGYTALINQNRALGGLAPLGFPNNSLYPLAYNASGLTANYATLFHDIANGSNNSAVTGGTVFSAVTGYDASTGLGTMQGPALIAALSGGRLYAAQPVSGDGLLRARLSRANTVLAAFMLPQPVSAATAARTSSLQ